MVDGQIVVNQQSLTVQAQAAAEYRRVVEDRSQLNSRTYRKTTKASESMYFVGGGRLHWVEVPSCRLEAKRGLVLSPLLHS